MEDNLLEDKAELEADNLLEGKSELEGVDSHKVVAHRAVEEDIQQWDMADQAGTSAEQGELPLAVHQTYRLAYPFQSCVASAIFQKDIE